MKQKVPSLNYSQAAMLAIDPRFGYIKTMVGGKDFLDNQFNRTTQSRRQPGSSFKPFLYLAALEKGFSPGQACVFYSKNKLGDKVLGGGWITKTVNKYLSTQLT